MVVTDYTDGDGFSVKLDEEDSCCGNFIGWERLVEELRKSGEIKASEKVVRLEIGERGIEYSVKRVS